MIRRLIIFAIPLTALAAGVCLVSHVWQFGYVGSWFTVGMREGRLWYVWRSSPIADARGFYSDAASAVNRAMHNINANARFNDEAAWAWVMGFAIFGAYVLLLITAFRIFRLRPPRWVTIFLLCATLLWALTWLGSQFRSVGYNGIRAVCGVYDGTLSLYLTLDKNGVIAPGTGRPTGWTLGAPPTLRMNFGQWFWISGGLVLVNLPVAIAVLALFPTAILCAYSRKKKPGHCRRCSYDLTGNVSGVCPECGQRLQAGEPTRAVVTLTQDR